jgi:hypothetical protein
LFLRCFGSEPRGFTNLHHNEYRDC